MLVAGAAGPTDANSIPLPGFISGIVKVPRVRGITQAKNQCFSDTNFAFCCFVLETDSRALPRLGKYSITELYPQAASFFKKYTNLRADVKK